LSDFNFPPKEVVKEGRYNHAGIPVLYLASDAKTCYYEMREIPCTIVELEIHKRLKILDFVEFDESTDDRTDTLKALVYSALISSKQDDEGWHKPKYIFSRFVADCAKYVGFDGIKYPSTRELRDNYNLVILNSSLSLLKNCEIKKFIKVTSAKDIR
jgi:hypothetical protein